LQKDEGLLDHVCGLHILAMLFMQRQGELPEERARDSYLFTICQNQITVNSRLLYKLIDEGIWDILEKRS